MADGEGAADGHDHRSGAGPAGNRDGLGQLSPPVERSFGTTQDRLVKEMRVEGIAGLAEANRLLAERWGAVMEWAVCR